MAWELAAFKLPGFIAGADLSGSQYLFVNAHSSAGEVVLAGAGEGVFGVLQNDPALGQAAEITSLGVSKVYSGGAFGFGAGVSADENGKAVAAAAGDFCGGFAMEAASDAEQLVSIFVLPGFGQINPA